jgi:hypothetical protein
MNKKGNLILFRLDPIQSEHPNVHSVFQTFYFEGKQIWRIPALFITWQLILTVYFSVNQ